jgi:hypothetical protein
MSFSLFYLAWSFCFPLFICLQILFLIFYIKSLKDRERIAIVGYDDNTNKLIEKLKRKSNNQFISHLSSENIFEYSNDANIIRLYRLCEKESYK